MLDKYQMLIQEGLGSFNKDLEKYRSDVQKVINQAQTTLQEAIANAKMSTDVSVQNKAKTMEAIVQDNNLVLQKFQQEVAAYAQKVNSLVSQYSTNNQIFQSKITKTIQEHTGLYVGLQQLQSEYHGLIDLYLGRKTKQGGNE
jgi:2-succinyl-5-enolpyruvyl-6-hydroxy-3-cyclohexene-1-carboxylate synthase